MLRRLWEYVRDAAGCRWRRGRWCCRCSQGVAQSGCTASTGRGGNVRAREGAVERDIAVSAFPRVRDGYSHSPSLSDLLIVDASWLSLPLSFVLPLPTSCPTTGIRHSSALLSRAGLRCPRQHLPSSCLVVVVGQVGAVTGSGDVGGASAGQA